MISPYAVQSIDWQANTIVVNLTRAQVEGSPGIDTAKPVSRQHEAAYHRYYGYPSYWQSMMFWASGSMPVIMPTEPQIPEEDEARMQADARQAGADHHLRSSRVVLGYRIEASDDLIGHVADFLFDEETWAMCYLMVDTRHWRHGKHVLISPRRIRAINWSERTLTVALKRKEIEQSPEYDPEYVPSREHEQAIYRRHPPSHHGE